MPERIKITYENWFHNTWRPAMGWMYFVVCITDFIVFPVFWSYLQTANGGQITSQWEPLTLKGAGLFHMAMGAIIGITAWTRSQEKIHTITNSNRDTYYNDHHPTDDQYKDQPISRKSQRSESL